MTSTAYQLWLKKREFKAPRLPPKALPRIASPFTRTRQLARALDDARDTSQATSDAGSAIETLETSDSRPVVAKKRPRAEGTGPKKQLIAATVAGCADVIRSNDAKVAGWKRQRSIEERPDWTKRAAVDPSFGLVAKEEDKKPTKSRHCSMQWYQIQRRKMKAEATLTGTTKQLWNCGGTTEKKDVEFSGLPPKSPKKPKTTHVTISMLDESQYWMAVDRFSHLA